MKRSSLWYKGKNLRMFNESSTALDMSLPIFKWKHSTLLLETHFGLSNFRSECHSIIERHKYKTRMTRILMKSYSKCLIWVFEFSTIFVLFNIHIDLSGSTVWPQVSFVMLNETFSVIFKHHAQCSLKTFSETHFGLSNFEQIFIHGSDENRWIRSLSFTKTWATRF